MGVCTYGKCMIFQPNVRSFFNIQASVCKNQMFNKNALFPLQQVFVFRLFSLYLPSPPAFFPFKLVKRWGDMECVAQQVI